MERARKFQLEIHLQVAILVAGSARVVLAWSALKVLLQYSLSGFGVVLECLGALLGALRVFVEL